MTKDEQKKLEKIINRLALKPVRVCRWLNHCILCKKEITSGQQYRDGGYPTRAHQDCFLDAVNQLRVAEAQQQR